jgi:hypothetical protein
MKFSEEHAAKQRREEPLANRPCVLKPLALKRRAKEAGQERTEAQNICGSRESAAEGSGRWLTIEDRT